MLKFVRMILLGLNILTMHFNILRKKIIKPQTNISNKCSNTAKFIEKKIHMNFFELKKVIN